MRKKLVFIFFLLLLSGFSIFLSYEFSEKKFLQSNNLHIIHNNENQIPFKKETLDIDYSFIEYYTLKDGDTLTSVLKKTKLTNREIDQLISSTIDKINVNKLKIGTRIEIISYLKDSEKTVKEIIIYPNAENKINISKVKDKFIVEKDIKTLFSKNKFYEVKIDKSIYESLKQVEVPDNIIMEFVQLFSFDIDFQRDIRNGNSLKIMFDQYYDKYDNVVKTGSIYFAEINLLSSSYELYRFKSQDMVEYFNADGKSATKALMKTPINGARLSSGFGMRKHPILGYNKKHQGVDFAAPTGTPIMAAGTGHIEFVGNNGGAGKYIRIKHLNGYKTSYSHLSKYASGIKKNVRVTQGQTIGYVGNTGLSTGPHLHYEVIYNGERINPMKMKLPSGKKLEGENLKNFLLFKEKTDNEISLFKS
ncbi:M23 family metallopeptidase [Pelagibacteraceae bacterium]|nr:M23 family metallopeptidase [Pelagibacteraceae bacterium]